MKNYYSADIFRGQFGIEREMVRVTPHGELSSKPHPKAFGNKLDNPYITTDFAESQLELVTPPCKSLKEALDFSDNIYRIVATHCGDELLWGQSMPPILPQDDKDIHIAQYDERGIEKRLYREQLVPKYGKKVQLISGIHFNVSFDDSVLLKGYQISKSSDDFNAYREALYMKTVRNFLKYRWFLVALTGCSPVADESFTANHFPYAISLRNSKIGYINRSALSICYNSLETYLESIAREVNKGIIFSSAEDYSPIRIKLTPENTISHLEVRLLDINPFEIGGVNDVHLQLTHMFIVFCMLKEEEATTEATFSEATKNHLKVSIEGLSPNASIEREEEEVPLELAIERVFVEISEYLEDILPKNYSENFPKIRSLVYNKSSRPAYKLRQALKSRTFLDFHLNQSKKFSELSHNTLYQSIGMEDLQLSTQLLLRGAILRGVGFDIIDRKEHVIRLYREDQEEYVVEATKTSLDNYSSILMMENKLATKHILSRHNISVPSGGEYYSVEEALIDFTTHQNNSVVIKPKSENFGIGVHILKQPYRREDFESALTHSLSTSSSVLIEEFITGREFRFFVMQGKVLGILHRVPANVTGNGHLTIRELVAEKNKDSLRGKGYKTPLEKISLKKPEELFLSTQGLTFDSVPQKGETVFLRENSNISTGGDSLDYTNEIHASYKEIAIQAAQALNVQITGLDMMIDNISEPATSSNYAIIELNFNPAIHIHCFPYKGERRPIHLHLLDALGFHEK